MSELIQSPTPDYEESTMEKIRCGLCGKKIENTLFHEYVEVEFLSTITIQLGSVDDTSVDFNYYFCKKCIRKLKRGIKNES